MRQIDFEHGGIAQNILKAALPMLVAQVLNLLYNIVDRIYIARIPDIGTVAVASRSRAITSGKTKKPAPTQTALADHVAQALRHRHSSIFTMDSFPQTLQYTVSDRARVSGLSRRTFPRPHRGQRSHPFFVSSLAVFASVCNAFSPLSRVCP